MTIEGIKTYNNLSEIPQGEYVGYTWMSDTQDPILVNGAFDHTVITSNPFITEGMLWDKSNDRSIMIKHTGRYIITQVDLKELAKEAKVEIKSYIGYKPTGKHFYKQIWLPEDPLYEGMEVLKLKAIVFTGFKED